ncbi:MAG: PepSY domain-containing protein [Methylococcales bacterium]
MSYRIRAASWIVVGLLGIPPLPPLRPWFDAPRCEPLILAALSLEQAARMVQGSAGGRVLGAETQIVEGRMVHVIKVLTADGKRVRIIQVDAESGQISGGR